jgi:hypothetical protein
MLDKVLKNTVNVRQRVELGFFVLLIPPLCLSTFCKKHFSCIFPHKDAVVHLQRTNCVSNYSVNACGPAYITISDGGNIEHVSANFTDPPCETRQGLRL